jgi:hypothetical protein
MNEILDHIQSERLELLKEQSVMLSELRDINDQITEYEESGTVHLSPVKDPSWIIRVRDARNHHLRKLRDISIELDRLKFRQKQLTRAVDTSLAAVFFKVAKDQLPEDLFNRLLECAVQTK